MLMRHFEFGRHFDNFCIIRCEKNNNWHILVVFILSLWHLLNLLKLKTSWSELCYTYVGHLECGGHIGFFFSWLHIWILPIPLNLSLCQVSCFYHKVINYSDIRWTKGGMVKLTIHIENMCKNMQLQTFFSH